MANQITVDIVADTRQLVAGVNTTNQQLNNLNQSVSKVKTAFGGLASALGFQVGASFLKDAIKGAADDEAAFGRLTDAFGEDIDAITKKVNEISSTFKVDDGAIAQYFVDLKGAFSSNFDPFVADVVEASATLALLTGDPVDSIIALWAKTLRDGKITAQEVQKLNIDLTAEQEKEFNKLKTTAERLQFLLDIINSPENQQKALDNMTPYQKWNYFMEKLSDTIGGPFLKAFEKFFAFYDKLTPKQQAVIDGVGAIVVGFLALAAVLAPVVFVGEALVGLLVAWNIKARLAAVAQGLLNLAMSPWLVVVLAAVAAGILLYKNWDTVKEMGQKLLDKLKGMWQWVKDNWEKLLAILGGPIGKAVAVIIQNWDKIKEGFKKTIDAVKALFSGDISAFTAFGRNIITGLVNGIKAMASAPINAVKSIASGIKDKFTSLFKIGSPSKVFAIYGKNLVEGLANGIEGAQRLAQDSMFSLSNGLSLSPSVGTSRGVNITINAGLGTDPYELGRVVKAAMDKYSGVNGR
jgi:hypothetical protein